MIFFKEEKEINLIRKSAHILSKTLGVIARSITFGVTTKKLDKIAETCILDHGGQPSFKGYKQFPASLCTSVNDVVVHGIPNHYELQEGDIVAVDCGVLYQGFHSDAAFTFSVGQISQRISKMLRITKEALYAGINQARIGKRVGDIGQAIHNYVRKHGYSVVRELSGHGIGKHLHEDPQVPNYGRKGNGIRLKPGMVLAIEPIINLGKPQVIYESDRWTIRTLDRKGSAHFEHTVAIKEHATEILTTYQYIEEALRN